MQGNPLLPLRTVRQASELSGSFPEAVTDGVTGGTGGGGERRGLAVDCHTGADKRAGIREPSPGSCELEDVAPGSGLNSANAVCPCCCILFGLGTCASSSGLGEVTGLGHCPQNTNFLGAWVWEKGGRAVGRSHELIPWGWGPI